MSAWPQLSKPVFPSVNDELARLMSAMTRGGKVPEFQEVQAAHAERQETK